MNENNNLIRIKDLYLAAALRSYGMELVETDRTDRRKQHFVFRNCSVPVFRNKGGIVGSEEADITGIEKMFLNKSLYFPPMYPNCIRDIKAIIHST